MKRSCWPTTIFSFLFLPTHATLLDQEIAVTTRGKNTLLKYKEFLALFIFAKARQLSCIDAVQRKNIRESYGT